MNLRAQLKSLMFPAREEIRSRLTLHDHLYLPVARARGKNRNQAVGPRTEVVIEGFPRSANSFAVDAFRAAQPTPVQIAHHLHAPAQIVAGAKRGLPTLLLIRDPMEAVPSLKALHLQGAEIFEHPPLTTSLKHFFRIYARFYECVWPWRERYVIGHFPDVTHCFDLVVQSLNERFGTAFTAFDPTEERVAALRNGQGYHAAPSRQRHRIRNGLEAELDDARDSKAAADARRIYDRILAHHESARPGHQA